MVGGCSRGQESSDDVLPEAFYGEWHLTESSGGIDGRIIPAEKPTRIVIRRDHTMATFVAGDLIASRPFEVSRGASIYSSEPQWFIRHEGDMEPQVIMVTADTLMISDNHYDGFSTSYRR